jgi:hypothetical protein
VHAWRQLLSPVHGEVGSRIVNTHPGLAVRGGGPCRTLFLHAGLRLSLGSKYGSIEGLNAALHAQVTSNRGPLLDAHEGPLWFRGYARPAYLGLSDDETCAELRATLASVGEGARRMAVGHNIVPFVATRCGGGLVNLDVGMSSAYGGRPAAWRCDVVPHSSAAAVEAQAEAQAEEAEAAAASSSSSGGVALTRALYMGGSEAPPDLCAACAGVHTDNDAGRLRGHDEHGDCHNYCSPPSGRAQLLMRRRAQQKQQQQQQQQQAAAAAAVAGESGGSSSSGSTLFGSWLHGSGGGSGGGDGGGNHVKTEF